MTIETERAEIEARAPVTERMRPLRVDGKIVHQIGAAVALGLQRRRARATRTNDLGALAGRSERLDPGVQGVHLQRPRRPARRRDDAEARRAMPRAPAMPSPTGTDAPAEDPCDA